ncbi:hydrolase [Russula earlei]|uniref:Hydrolase n=1 Tax=Russula earlei TaxID=71964 RepID=A0ACC0U3E7_9AGAM|nr:hydrolase [Russula earlei]
MTVWSDTPSRATSFYNPARKPLLLKGAAGPLSGELHSANDFHGRLNLPPDYLSESTRNHPHLEISDSPAPEATLGLLREHAALSVTYVSLGPLTNLARMLWTDGACVRERIGCVVIIGGVLDVPGNATPSAEFNFLVDPYAVDEVLISPTTRLPPGRVLLPLDVTSHPPTCSRSVAMQRGVMRAYGRDAMELHNAVWAAIAHPPGLEGFAPGWTARHRVFRIERRDDQKARAPGANRAHVDAELKKRMVTGSAETGDLGLLESVVMPAVEDER